MTCGNDVCAFDEPTITKSRRASIAVCAKVNRILIFPPQFRSKRHDQNSRQDREELAPLTAGCYSDFLRRANENASVCELAIALADSFTAGRTFADTRSSSQNR